MAVSMLDHDRDDWMAGECPPLEPGGYFPPGVGLFRWGVELLDVFSPSRWTCNVHLPFRKGMNGK
jgi:hypothetical protein